jgi:hypothetical protein
VKLNPETLARASSRHAWRTVGIWAVILILGFGASGVLLSKALTTDFDFTNNPEAIQAQTLLQQKQLEQDVTPETFVMTGSQGATTDPGFTANVNAALNEIRALDPSVVLQVPSQFPLSQADKSNPQVAALGPFPSEDGTAVLFNVILVKDSDQTARSSIRSTRSRPSTRRAARTSTCSASRPRPRTSRRSPKTT